MEDLVILDTCVLFDFLAGKRKTDVPLVEQLLLDARAAVSVVSIFELLRGVESQKQTEQRNELLGLCVPLDLTPPIAQRAAGIYAQLKKKGSLIHMEDILIAATALHWRYTVMTSNTKDFSRISGVELQN